jgi:hypothetical protein
MRQVPIKAWALIGCLDDQREFANIIGSVILLVVLLQYPNRETSPTQTTPSLGLDWLNGGPIGLIQKKNFSSHRRVNVFLL